MIPWWLSVGCLVVMGALLGWRARWMRRHGRALDPKTVEWTKERFLAGDFARTPSSRPPPPGPLP